VTAESCVIAVNMCDAPALRAVAFQLAVRAGVALRAVAFQLAVRAGVARCAVDFQLAVGAGDALRTVRFQLAVGVGVAVRAAVFPLAVGAGVALCTLAFQLAVKAWVALRRCFSACCGGRRCTPCSLPCGRGRTPHNFSSPSHVSTVCVPSRLVSHGIAEISSPAACAIALSRPFTAGLSLA
jgi:hypothetical protein